MTALTKLSGWRALLVSCALTGTIVAYVHQSQKQQARRMRQSVLEELERERQRRQQSAPGTSAR